MWKVIPLGFAVAFIGVQLTAQPPAGSQQPNADKKNQKDYSNSSIVTRMMAFNKKKDGKLTKEEVTDTRLHRLFDLADTNKDGVVTREELMALAAKMDAEYGQDGPGGKGPGGPGGGKGKGKGKGGFGGPGGPGGFGGKGSPIHDIMVKIGRGPESLGDVIGEELEADSPPWDKLRSQTKEYAQFVAALAKEQPPKGSKESWAKLTGRFANWAVALDRSVQKKDKDAALTVHGAIANSCMACHRQHKGGPGGGGFADGFPGGPGGFDGFGGPGGGKGKGPGGFGGGPGGFGGPPQPGQILPPFLLEQLNLTGVQKQQVNELQKQVDSKLAKILTDDQRKQLKEMGNRSPGGFGRPPGSGGFGPPRGGPGGPGGGGPSKGKQD